MTELKRANKTRWGLELAFAIIVGCIAYALLVPTGPRGRRVSPVARLGLELACLSQAMEAFRMHMGSYPSDFSGADIDDEDALFQVFRAKLTADGAEPATSKLDPAEALFFWLGGSTEESYWFFDFDRSRLRDTDGDGHLEYYPPNCRGNAPYIYAQASQVDGANQPTLECLNGRMLVQPYDVLNVSGKLPGYQLICAGLDGSFGNGGNYSTQRCKADDDNLTNFSRGKTLRAFWR